jgi:hypothetical protein
MNIQNAINSGISYSGRTYEEGEKIIGRMQYRPSSRLFVSVLWIRSLMKALSFFERIQFAMLTLRKRCNGMAKLWKGLFYEAG